MADFPFDIVGFDLDGTLVDTRADLAASVNHALSLLGRAPLSLDAVEPMIGRGTRHMLEQALAVSGGCDPATIGPLHHAMITHYAANIAVHSRPYPGAEAALHALGDRGVRIGLVTNKLEHLALALLGALRLEERFDCVIGGDTLGPGNAKPSPLPLHEMVRRCGGGRAAFVGDSVHDAEAAHAANMPFVAVRFGYTRDVAVLHPHSSVGSFSELLPALQALP